MVSERDARDEDRDSVSPEPEERDPADAGGDSPGPSMGVPDRPVASTRPGTTAQEQGEPALERRLEMERPDVWETGRAGDEREPIRPILDDDVATEDLNAEEPMFDAAEADLDRTREEASEESPDLEDEGPEGAAMHVEPD
jgi:hypothetical protein